MFSEIRFHQYFVIVKTAQNAASPFCFLALQTKCVARHEVMVEDTNLAVFKMVSMAIFV